MRFIVLLSIWLLSSFVALGTHIIGGYISYTHLSGNDYKIELVVYRDCYNGVPPFDNPASVAVYDASGTLLSNLMLVTGDSTYVMTPVNCLIPSNICIRKATYDTTITLPPTGGPFTLAYQRCCRSAAIINLASPYNAGMTFYTVIDPLIVNNSAVYNSEFAAFTDAFEPFSFDGSAFDPDGDSLVYSLDDALDGASQNDPQPQPPSPPPYSALAWQPPYSMSDMLGGSVPLTIDPATGVITAVPGSVGVFVICQKADEYRNGMLINTIRREFVMDIKLPYYQDITGSVLANNGSQNLDIGKIWLVRFNFLDSTLSATDTNSVSAGSFQFPQEQSGSYLVKGSADSNSIYYADNLPTYYGDVLYWHQGTFINNCGVPVSVNINLVQGVNPGGPGFVGGFISQGANRMQSQSNLGGITILAIDMAGQPMAYDVTDANGYFEIGNLPVGDVKLYVDRLGYYVDNSVAPTISLTSAMPVVNNLAFEIHESWLELLGFVGVDESGQIMTPISIFPNPVVNELMIGEVASTLKGSHYAIYNAYGQKVMTGTLFGSNIDVSELATDLYVLVIESGSRVVSLKFLKN